MTKVIKEVGEENLCKLYQIMLLCANGISLKFDFRNFFWHLVVLFKHLNLALNIVDVICGEYSWITKIANDVSYVKNSIVNHFLID